MIISDLQKARQENDSKKIIDIVEKEINRLKEVRDKKDFYCKKYSEAVYNSYRQKFHDGLFDLRRQLVLELINKDKLQSEYIQMLSLDYDLYITLLKYSQDNSDELNKINFDNSCKRFANKKEIFFIDEKYRKQKKLSKYNISHLVIKFSELSMPKWLKRLVLKPFSLLNSEIYYRLSLLVDKSNNKVKWIEYLNKGVAKSNVNCVKELANYYKKSGKTEKQIETLYYGASYDYMIAYSLAKILLESKSEENINKAISIFLIYHAYCHAPARETLAKIFSVDSYGKKDLDIALLLYSSLPDENDSRSEFINRKRDYFISKTDEALEEFDKVQKEFDKMIQGEITKEEVDSINQEETERKTKEQEEIQRKKKEQKAIINKTYNIYNVDEIFDDYKDKKLLMMDLVNIYLEHNLQFDTKFVNLVIDFYKSNPSNWIVKSPRLMYAIFYKYGYISKSQAKGYTQKDAFETFKEFGENDYNAIMYSRGRYELAKCYEEGYYVAKDLDKAKKYYSNINKKHIDIFNSQQNDKATYEPKSYSEYNILQMFLNKDIKGLFKAYTPNNDVIFSLISIYLNSKLEFDREFLDCVLDYRKFGEYGGNDTINYVIALAYKYNYFTEEEKNNYRLVDMFSNIESYALKHNDTHAYNELAKCYEEGFLVSKNIDKAIEYYKKSDKEYAKKLQDKQGTKKVVEQIPEKKRIENFVTNAYERFLKEYPEKGKIVEYRTNRFFLNDVDMKFIYELLNNGYQMYYLFNEKGDYIGSSYLGVKGIKDFASVKSEIDKKDRLERERKLEQQKKLEQQQLEAQRLEQQRKLDEQKRLEQQRKLEQEQLKKEQTKKVATSSVNNTSKTSVASTSNNVTSKQNTTTTSAQNTTTSTKVNTSKNVNLSTSGANAKISEVRKKYGYVEKPTDMPSKDEYGNEITSIAKRQKLYSKQLDEYYKSQGVYEKNILNAIKESSNRKCNQIDEKTFFAINDSKPIHDKSGFEFEINHNYKKMVQNYKKNYIRHLGDLGDIGVEITDIKYCNSKGQVMNDVWIAERELAGLPVYAKVIVEVEIYDNCLTFKSDIDYISEMYNLMNAFEESDLAKFSTFSEFTQKTTLGFETEQRSRNMRHSAIADGKDVYKQVIRKAVSNTFKNNHIILHEKAIVRNNIFPAYVIDYSLVFKWQKQY